MLEFSNFTKNKRKGKFNYEKRRTRKTGNKQ